MKALIVCLSSELPSFTNRDSNTIYFVYNRMELWEGQAPRSTNFSIVESMPVNPEEHRLYIDLSDGYAKVYDDYQVKNIALVQSEEQLDVLRQAGTMHFCNMKEQYLDTNTRMLVIPYSDGQYTYTIDMPKDLEFTEDTVTKYNTESGEFEVYGETLDKDPLETKGWHGHETASVRIRVEDGTIKAKVKISQADKNILKVLDDGLYAYPHNTLSQEEFNSWKASYQEYKELIDYYMTIIEQALEEAAQIINEEVIDEKIRTRLEEEYPTIDEAIEKYDILAEKVDELFDYAEEYATAKFEEATAEIDEMIEEALEDPWDDMVEPGPEDEENPPAEDPDA